MPSKCTELAPLTLTLASPDELPSAVRGGRVPAWVGKIANVLHVSPVMIDRDGKMGVAGFSFGRGADPRKLARRALKRMRPGDTYRVLIAHASNPGGAREVRRVILEGHGSIHSCLLADAGPALGVHLGRGGLIVGLLPHR